jgi:uncharacterized protein YabE (DUF348 family)/3D (Asp-Asp-Asp) domain-containing protein
MTFMFLVLLYGTAVKSVSVVVNGQETVIHTKEWVLQRLLDEQAITIGPYDEVSVPLGSTLKDGDRIEITHAIPVTVMADGKTSTVYTTDKTVKAAIDQLDLSVRSQDIISPALDVQVEANDVIKIVRVDTKMSEQEKSVPFTIVKKEDPTLEKGKEKLVQTGKEGVVVEKYQDKYEDGVLVGSKMVSEVVQKPAVEQVVAVGTKKPAPKVTVLTSSSPDLMTVTKGDTTFKAKKVIKNMTLTAYSADFASTGKSEGDANYGITASGTRVQEGRTIAVDPNVIPLGWWVYIEGIGFRRAEDKGSAVKGNKIDVYFDSESYANKFGKKTGYTVYILGPNKPTAS